jgi:hypothetical protein
MIARLCLLAALAAACPTAAGQNARRRGPSHRAVSEGGITFVYSPADFGGLKVESVPRLTAQEIGNGVPSGQGPAHNCVNLESKRPLPALDKGPRYFFPSQSFVCAVPLTDSSVEDFNAAYPLLRDAAASLRKIIRARPRQFGRLNKWGTWDGIPDYPYSHSGYSLRSRGRYLDSRTLSGILFLTQYSQDTQPSPANNEELTYNFQGLTRDGRHYVAARFAVTHPSMPKGIDFVGRAGTDKQLRYLRRDELRLNRLAEDSFAPSLKSLKALLSSIEIR